MRTLQHAHTPHAPCTSQQALNPCTCPYPCPSIANGSRNAVWCKPSQHIGYQRTYTYIQPSGHPWTAILWPPMHPCNHALQAPRTATIPRQRAPAHPQPQATAPNWQTLHAQPGENAYHLTSSRLHARAWHWYKTGRREPWSSSVRGAACCWPRQVCSGVP